MANEVFENGAVRLEVTVTAEDSGGELFEMRGVYQPDSPFPPAHLHPDQDERFMVREGALTFVVDGRETVVTAGESIDLPRGSVHQARNAGTVPAIVTWQTRPALRTGDFHREMHRCLAARDWPGLGAALEGYGDVFRLAPAPQAIG